jgi:hypothetical protein
MRILVAHGDAAEKIRYTQIFAKYGSVDFFDNGQDAVVSFVNAFQTGNFYNLLVIENDLKQLDGVEAVLMIRKYELENLAFNNKVIIEPLAKKALNYGAIPVWSQSRPFLQKNHVTDQYRTSFFRFSDKRLP